MLLFAEPFLRLWMGSEFASQALGPFRILILVYALMSVSAPAFHIANGAGVPWINAIASLGGGLVTIALVVVLARSIGLEGAAWANAGAWIKLVTIVCVYCILKRPVKAKACDVS